MASVTTRTRTNHHALPAMRWVVLLIVGLYLILPLLGMLEFSTRGTGPGGRSLDAWKHIGTNFDLVASIGVSLGLAVLTVAGMIILLLPTMVWIHLRVPQMRRVIEFVCILPLTIPAIVLVVGLAPIYSWVSYFFGESPLTLTFIYVILVLPYAYRAIDAGLQTVDVITLAEAARSLGASWFGVLTQIVIPNIRSAIISASIISVALVLGEFTIASLLSYNTLQVVINLIGKRDASVSVAVSLAALMFGFILLLIVSAVGSRNRSNARVGMSTEELSS